MFLQSKLKTLLVCIAIPLITGTISGLLSGNSMEAFQQLKKPPLSPPGYLFPIVWTILYTLMGIAAFFVYTSEKNEQEIHEALKLYGLQLAINFFWSIFFFNFEWYLFSFIWLVLLWILILKTIFAFSRISPKAACLLIPYLLWVTFAGYLNFSIYVLNTFAV